MLILKTFIRKQRLFAHCLGLSILISLAGLAGLTWTNTAVANSSDLPNLGDPSASYISPSKERKMGRQFMAAIRYYFPLMYDPIINQYVANLGYQLVGNTNMDSSLNFHFHVVETPIINAVAGPDGNIVIASGLILATKNESQLASVIAHEVAHVTQRHLAQNYEYEKRALIPLIAGIAASVALATQNGEAGGGALAATMAGSVEKKLNFQRGNEATADRVGMEILYNAGFEPQGMPDFFTRLQQMDRYYAKAPEYLSDHPLTDERIADMQHRVAQYKPRHLLSNTDYQLVRERIRVATAPNSVHILTYYQDAIKSAKSTHKLYLKYGLALAQARNFNYKVAENGLRSLIATDPQQLIYPISLAEVQLDAQKPQQALNTLKSIVNLNPDYYPAVYTYAHALINANQAKQAVRFIQHKLPEFSQRPQMYWLYARAQAASGDLARAYEANAHAYYLQDDTNNAIQQLQVALNQPDINRYARERIQARLKALQGGKKKAKS